MANKIFFNALRLWALIILLVLFGLPAFAQLSVSPIFGDDMVLQRNTTAPVFGTAAPGATVTVSFGNQTQSTIADASGNWQVGLGSMEASSKPAPLTITSEGNTIILEGVQVGEVWLCSGQSNMGWPMNKADNSASAISTAGNHNIRLFQMTAGNGPSTTTWKVSNSSTVASFSAVGYWMGLELSQWFKDVPIGLIQATHDGTAIEHWQHSSGGIGDDYDAMVKAIQPFAVKGVAWYQGESNGGDAQYATKLKNMLAEWRSDWGLPDLPFGIIQLAYRSGWNVARNAQLEVADGDQNAFLVVIRDLKGAKLHPTEKQPVGIRTAIGARGKVYGEGITYSGPVRDIPNSYISGNKIVLNWKHSGEGLFTDDGAAPGPFLIAGSTGQFKSATAEIVGNTIHLSNATVANPTRVQYAYSGVGNLYNRVNVLTEGETVVVDRLKASEFEITLNATSPTAASRTAVSEIELDTSNKKFAVYPNPSSTGSFHLEANGYNPTQKLKVQVIDLKGKIVYQRKGSASEFKDIESNLVRGGYIIRITDDAGIVANQKLVVR